MAHHLNEEKSSIWMLLSRLYNVFGISYLKGSTKDMIDHVSFQNNLKNNYNTSLYNCTTQKGSSNILYKRLEYLRSCTSLYNCITQKGSSNIILIHKKSLIKFPEAMYLPLGRKIESLQTCCFVCLGWANRKLK